jgi:hypothetical protein
MGESNPLETTANYDAAADESPTPDVPAAADMAEAQPLERIGRCRAKTKWTNCKTTGFATERRIS